MPRILADIFATEGVTVLAYDKQGVGQSEGNCEYESFTDLANDAFAGIDFFKTRKTWHYLKLDLEGVAKLFG